MKLLITTCPICGGAGKDARTEVQGFSLDGPILGDTVYQCICNHGTVIQFETRTQYFDGMPYELFIAWVNNEVRVMSSGLSTGANLSDYILKNNKLDEFHAACSKAEQEWVSGIRLYIESFDAEDTEMTQRARAWQQTVGALLNRTHDMPDVLMDGSTLVVKYYDDISHTVISRYPLFFFHDPALMIKLLGITPLTTKEEREQKRNQLKEDAMKEAVFDGPETEEEDLPF